jgi:histidine triad (HIT) family protein
MLNDCLFCAIAAREIPGSIVHEDELTVAFRDIDPVAPTHVLVVPRRHIADIGDLAESPAEARAVLAAIRDVAAAEGLASYRTVFNTGAGAGQSVWHVHAHVIGGRDLRWPPG